MPKIFAKVSKEISWLAFNERVLQQAMNADTPLLERLRFLGIYSSNQDEFFKVQLANLQQSALENTNDSTEAKLLRQIQKKSQTLSSNFSNCFKQIQLDLKLQNIAFLYGDQLNIDQKLWLDNFFANKILRHLVPIYINESSNLEPQLSDARSYLVVRIDHILKTDYALIDLPENLPRFIELPKIAKSKQRNFMILDEVIRHGLPQILGGFFDIKSLDAWSMKISRNADIKLKSHSYSNLIDNLSQSLKLRLFSDPVRISFDQDMPQELLKLLSKILGLDNLDCFIAGGRYRNFRDFIKFPSCGSKLDYKQQPPVTSSYFTNFSNVFQAISAGDIMLIYPYHRFSHFTEFVRQAASDPTVTSIFINVYRIANDSTVIESLIDAATNGKQVTVNVEVRARFDEARNISLVNRLINSRVQVTTGIPSLKVHCKICLVKRVENGKVQLYANVSTGNFNEQTAKIYSDISLFTKDNKICNELKQVFRFISHSFLQFKFKNLLVSPINLRQQLIAFIEKQSLLAKEGLPAMITFKVNHLTDDKIIEKLIEAANLGVKVRLLVRTSTKIAQSILSENNNLTVISLVGRYLEHSRVYWFGDDIDGEIFISSADLMERNLDSRVEVAIPIKKRSAREKIIFFLNKQLADNANTRVLDPNLKNEYVLGKPTVDSHKEVYTWIKELES